MKHFKKFLLLPTLLLPYYLVFNFVVIFFSSYSDVLAHIEEQVFKNDIFHNVLWLAVFLFGSLLLTIIYLLISRKSDDVKDLVKTGMILKLCQVPAYIAIFVMGVVALFGFIFTFILIPLYFGFDCLSVALTGLVSLPGSIKGKNFVKAKKGWVLLSIFNFIMNIDVVSSIIQFVLINKSDKKA